MKNLDKYKNECAKTRKFGTDALASALADAFGAALDAIAVRDADATLAAAHDACDPILDAALDAYNATRDLIKNEVKNEKK